MQRALRSVAALTVSLAAATLVSACNVSDRAAADAFTSLHTPTGQRSSAIDSTGKVDTAVTVDSAPAASAATPGPTTGPTTADPVTVTDPDPSAPSSVDAPSPSSPSDDPSPSSPDPSADPSTPSGDVPTGSTDLQTPDNDGVMDDDQAPVDPPATVAPPAANDALVGVSPQADLAVSGSQGPMSAGSIAAPTAAHPLRGMFYYPWFPQAWAMHRNPNDPFSHYAPSAGYYSTDDAALLHQQVLAMRYAKMNVAISNWTGQRQVDEDTRFPMQLAAARGTGLSWSLYYGKEGRGRPSVAEIVSDLRYIKTRYATSPQYLKINQRPVIFVWGNGGETCDLNNRWHQANAEVGNSFYVILKVFPGFRDCRYQPDSWHQYSPSTAAFDQKGVAFALGAGFWLKKDSKPELARDPARWRRNIQQMVASREPMQMVATFNEWGEGTAVESARQWSSRSGFGTYLDALHDIL